MVLAEYDNMVEKLSANAAHDARLLCERRPNLAGRSAYARETSAIVVRESQAESARTNIENGQAGIRLPGLLGAP
jgi:hypothetical protein